VDDINNSIILQATSADYAYLLETIKKMDVLPRQVIIDARIFEVDLTNDLTFGVNAYLQAKGDTSKGTTLTTGSIEGEFIRQYFRIHRRFAADTHAIERPAD